MRGLQENECSARTETSASAHLCRNHDSTTISHENSMCPTHEATIPRRESRGNIDRPAVSPSEGVSSSTRGARVPRTRVEDDVDFHRRPPRGQYRCESYLATAYPPSASSVVHGFSHAVAGLKACATEPSSRHRHPRTQLRAPVQHYGDLAGRRRGDAGVVLDHQKPLPVS